MLFFYVKNKNMNFEIYPDRKNVLVKTATIQNFIASDGHIKCQLVSTYRLGTITL